MKCGEVGVLKSYGHKECARTLVYLIPFIECCIK